MEAVQDLDRAPGALDVVTDGDRPFKFSRSYGYGQISSSTNLMLLQSATRGWCTSRG